jgi:hypothetical protein
MRTADVLLSQVGIDVGGAPACVEGQAARRLLPARTVMSWLLDGRHLLCRESSVTNGDPSTKSISVRKPMSGSLRGTARQVLLTAQEMLDLNVGVDVVRSGILDRHREDQVERDGWIPLATRSPERVPEWMARKREQLADPQLIAFYLTLGQTLDRTDDDPRLADKLAAYITQMADERGENYVDDTDIEPPLVKLMDTLAFDTVPPARRPIELLKKRGWTGWTELKRVDPAPAALLGWRRPGSRGLKHESHRQSPDLGPVAR